MLLKPLSDRRGAAHRGHALVRGQNDAEFDAFRKAAADHDSIAMFKNVEGKGRARKENNIEGKKWYSNRFHRLRSVDSGQHGLLLPTTAFVSALTHQCQSSLHFISRMHIARFLRRQDSLGQKFAG